MTGESNQIAQEIIDNVADVDKQEGMTILDVTYIQMFLANLPGVPVFLSKIQR